MNHKTIAAFLATSAVFLAGGTAFAGDKITATTSGMTCEACADTVKTRLAKNEAVEAVEVDPDTGVVVVLVKDDADFSDDDLTSVVDWAGYEVLTITREEA